MTACLEYQKKEIPQYVTGLLKCPERKVCTNLAETLEESHDAIYRDFQQSISFEDGLSDELVKLAKQYLNVENLLLIFDDTQITKLYAKYIEGLDLGFDGSLKKPALGIKMITSLLTDGETDIPIDTMPFMSKAISQNSYQTKSEIAIEITQLLTKIFTIKMILADAHFATNGAIQFFVEHKQDFLMKIPRHRLVEIDGQKGQLQKVFRLQRNKKVKCKQGTINGIHCYFYVVKIKDKSTMYFISNNQIDPYEVVNLYRIRWKIEIFHRTAKQKLGLGDCQMRSMQKQRHHVLHVMHAYAIAYVNAKFMKLESTEKYIKYLRVVKSNQHPILKPPTRGNFQCFA